MRDTNYFAAMSVHLGDADAMITGTTQNYADSVRPCFTGHWQRSS